ncbi:MAG: GNAT family N-acetyltransferase [Burkholderiales bacterium]
MENALRSGTADVGLRPLASGDFDDAVAIDAAILGRRRRAYFDGRLKAALKAPEDHVQFAAVREGKLAGYVLARRMAGEFGRTEPALRLETLGVWPERQGRGIGMRLLGELERWGLKHAIRQIRTTSDWRNHALLGFLDRAGFELGRNQIIDCAVHAERLGRLESADAVTSRAQRGEGTEVDYGAPASNDFETLARDRAEVRGLAPGDLQDIIAVDREITGRSRESYLTRLFEEALNDSAIRVSLVAMQEMAVGFIMAKTDFGDFGRTAPTAVIDTIGVHPQFAGSGIGTAMLSQLFVNLHALHVERVETVVAPENFDLLGFFYKAGFSPSQRLALVKRLT